MIESSLPEPNVFPDASLQTLAMKLWHSAANKILAPNNPDAVAEREEYYGKLEN